MADVEIGSSTRRLNGSLVEAYKGYYEEELDQEYDRVSEAAADDLTISEEELWRMDKESFVNRRVRQMILEHTPKQRLAVYLEWNGILGYTDTIYDIVIGNIYVGGF